MNKVGITVGKFMPFHIGHEFMIDFAVSQLDSVDVIVSGNETDIIPLSVRYGWLSQRYANNSKVKIHYHIDNIPMGDTDENGTVIDTAFWNQWIKVFRDFSPYATHFVSSDMYGQKAAHLLGIKWLPVDPKRETFKISGTAIRQDPMKHWDMITHVAKNYYLKRIAIVGPESTGKSTLTAYLAEHFNTVGVHEYGRTISETKSNVLDKNDFIDILQGQNAMIEIASKHANKILFTDTEAFTTYLFGLIYLNTKIPEIYLSAISQHFDHYIVLAPTVKWIDDGTRVIPDYAVREKFYNSMISFLTEHNKSFTVVDDTSYRERTTRATNIVNNLLKNKEIQ